MSDAVVVRYGAAGYLGRFSTQGHSYSRGQEVLVRTIRGQEVGWVLGPSNQGELPGGLCLRPVGPDDRERLEAQRVLALALLNRANQVGEQEGLPATFPDVEAILDGPVILHVLRWDAVTLDDVRDRLSDEFGCELLLYDISGEPMTSDPQLGCGKPNCGESSGGCSSCSTGSCSRGTVRSAEELTSYFVSLRQQMESAGLVRRPLN